MGRCLLLAAMGRYLLLAAACVVAGPVHAGELGEIEAAIIQLHGFSGVVYYTSQSDGYRVVATLSEGESGPPVRFEATLLDGQRVTVSVPGKLGEPSYGLEMMRLHQRLVVSPLRASEAASLPKVSVVIPPKVNPVKAIRKFDF